MARPQPISTGASPVSSTDSLREGLAGLGEIVSLDGLLQSQLALLLCYPRYDSDEGEWRLRELRSLGVEGLELRGRHRVGGMPVLGKGHVGVVVAARFEGASAALKIRRVDADRESLDAEAENLRIANRVSVGPRLLGVSDNFLLMETDTAQGTSTGVVMSNPGHDAGFPFVCCQ